MKEVIKVSLAGISFTISNDAYELLNSYLNELKAYYTKEKGNGEVVDDIEERVSELIIEKSGRDGVVSVETVNEIIGILGRPSDIEGDDKTSEISDNSENTPVKKRFYRDPRHRIIGGVCSGLAEYFKIDVVWIRLIFVAIGIFGFSTGRILHHILGIHISAFGIVCLAYIILWIIVPKAKTVADRCAMKGERQDVNDIEKRFNNGSKDYSSSDNQLVKILTIIVGAILIAIGVGGLIFGCGLFFGLMFYNHIAIADLINCVQLNISNLWIFKFLLCAVYFLPFVGMLYAGIKMCFNLKMSKYRIGVIIFVLWVLAIIGFSVVATKVVAPYVGYTKDSVEYEFPKVYDTLYIRYADPDDTSLISKRVTNIDNYDDKILYRNTKNGLVIIDYPNVDLRYTDSTYTKQNELECIMHHPDTNGAWGLVNYDALTLTEMDKIYSVKDSLITIYPLVFSKNNKFNGKGYEINISVPESTQIIYVNKNRY